MRFDLNSMWNVLWLNIHMFQSTICQSKFCTFFATPIPWLQSSVSSPALFNFVQNPVQQSGDLFNIAPFRRTPITELEKAFCLQKGDENGAFAIWKIFIHKTETCCDWTVCILLVDFPDGHTWFTTQTLRLDNSFYNFLCVISQIGAHKVCEPAWLEAITVDMPQRGQKYCGLHAQSSIGCAHSWKNHW